MTKQKPLQEKDIENVAWDDLWFQENILNQLKFLRKIIHIFLGVSGLLSIYLDKYIVDNKKYSFIELGCAGSSYLPYLAKKYDNLHLFGIDKSKMGCKLALIGFDKDIQKFNIVHGDIFKSPLKTEKFDIVFSLGLLEHFDNPSLILKKHVELLKPNGLLICVVPNFYGIQGKFYDMDFWYPDDMPEECRKDHVWGMKQISLKDLKLWFTDYGLKDILVKPTGGLYPFMMLESYRSKNVPLSFKILYFIYRYVLFLPSVAINIPLFFRLNSKHLSPFFIAVGKK
jgi:SAM-dependent methyltransferase